jgi:predicted GNAT family acetyltransferase
MTTDKTGAKTTGAEESDRFGISVEGRPAGFTEFADRDGQRVFTYTEVDDEFEGRGLKEAGLRIVPVCKLVAVHVEKHSEFGDVVDPPTPDIEEWLGTAS